MLTCCAGLSMADPAGLLVMRYVRATVWLVVNRTPSTLRVLALQCRVAAAEAAARADHDASQRLRAELRGVKNELDYAQKVCFHPQAFLYQSTHAEQSPYCAQWILRQRPHISIMQTQPALFEQSYYLGI